MTPSQKHLSFMWRDSHYFFQPSSVFLAFFVSLSRVHESDQRRGLGMHPFVFAYDRTFLSSFFAMRPAFCLITVLFLSRCGMICPGVLSYHRIVFVSVWYGLPRRGVQTRWTGEPYRSWLRWHGLKTTPHVEQSNGPHPLKCGQPTTTTV